MVFVLKNLKNGKELCLSYEREHKIGRRSENDIVVANDPSVSKEHALLTTKDDKVVVRDLDSKRGTFVNGLKIERPYTLKNCDKVKFGLRDTEIQFFDLKWVTQVPRMVESDKQILEELLKNCRVKLAANWSENYTHFTTNRITLCEEALLALVERKPFVTILFWLKLENSIRDNNLVPDASRYLPALDEDLRKAGVNFNPDLRRRFLFEERIFISFDEVDENSLFVKIIEKCGGTVLFWRKLCKTNSDVGINPNYILVNTPNVGTYLDTKNHKNLFSKKDIFLAILRCSSHLHTEPNGEDSAGVESSKDSGECTTLNLSPADSTTPEFISQSASTDNEQINISLIEETGNCKKSPKNISTEECIPPKKPRTKKQHSHGKIKQKSTLVLNPFAKVNHSQANLSASLASLDVSPKKATKKQNSLSKWLHNGGSEIIDLTEDGPSNRQTEQNPAEDIDSYLRQIKKRYKYI